MTAEIVWELATRFGDYPAIAVHDRVVYGVARKNGIDAVDLDTGEPRWHLPLDQVSYGPAIAEDAVYFATAKPELVAAARADGEIRWTAALSEAVYHAPVLADGAVLVRTTAGTVVAFEAATGAQRWSARYPGRGFDLCRPLVIAARVLVAHGDGLAVLDLETGTCVTDIALPELNVLLDDGDAVYSFAIHGTAIHVHDRSTFAVTRVVRLSWDAVDVLGPKSVAVRGVIYTVSAADRRVMRFDTTAASPALEPLGVLSEGPLVVAGEQLYVTPHDEIVAIDLGTRDRVWSTSVPRSGFASAPVIASDLVVATSEGKIAVVRR
ncbi:MAG: PQQ-binding-like beta-propeller repeat protein [Kofleriaceae bacterium]